MGGGAGGCLRMGGGLEAGVDAVEGSEAEGEEAVGVVVDDGDDSELLYSSSD